MEACTRHQTRTAAALLPLGLAALLLAIPGCCDKVVDENPRQTMEDIRSRSPLLAEMEAAGDIAIVGAIDSLETGRVTLLD